MAGVTTEKIVQEWLNQQGFLTIRQVSVGRGDIDILAIRHLKNECDCRHYEVQGADKPMGYIVPYKRKKDGKEIAKKRNMEQMREAIIQWVNDRYLSEKKKEIREKIADCNWTFHFVIHNYRYREELKILKNLESPIKVTVTHLHEVCDRLQFQKFLGIQSAEKDLVNLTLVDQQPELKRRFVNFLKQYVLEPCDSESVKVQELRKGIKDNDNIPKWLQSTKKFNYTKRGNFGVLQNWKFKESWLESVKQF